jgi:phage baseplate assembly protein W
MSLHYYKAFIDVQRITVGKPMDTCSLGESISQLLFMIVSTRKGEMPGDPDFGCAIWDLQFEIVMDAMKWKYAVEQSILEGIQRYEKRLENPSVHVSLLDVEAAYPFRQHPEIKKQATIQVQARLKHSQENFNFSTKIFVSPLAN